jgi:intein/homing endonuclease
MIKYHLIKIINDILKNALRINIRNLEETYILLQTTYGSAYNDAINESREYEKEEETDMEE